MRVAEYDTLTELWHGAAEAQILAKKKDLDFIASIDTMRYNNLLHCNSMEFDFDMGRDLWLNKQRFTVLQRDYLDQFELDEFLQRCEDIGLGEGKRGVITQMFARQHTRRAKKYRWGNCMMAWTFRGGNKGNTPVLTMHSRVAYIAYMGGLDLALCNVLARYIGERIGRKPEEFQFNWILDSSQAHFFKSIPYIFHREDLLEALHDTEGYPSRKHPTLDGIRKWYEKIVAGYEAGMDLEEEKYGPLRRIRRRYTEFQDGILLPEVTIDDLNFDRLYER